MKRIIIVVAGGRVETVFAPEKIDVEIVDFDGATSTAELQEFGDYVNACRQVMTEIAV